MEIEEFLNKLKVSKQWPNFVSLATHSNPQRGICEVLREIYDDVYKIEDKYLKLDLTSKLIDAMIMANKMSKRLGYYQSTYKDKTGHLASNIQRSPKSRRRLHFRRDRKLLWWEEGKND